MRVFILSALLFVAASCSPAAAPKGESHAGDEAGIEISDAWAAPTPGGASVSAGYLTLENHGAADRLLGASSGRAGSVQIHTMDMADGVMRMRELQSVDLGAGETHALAPGGDHLMFIGVVTPFAEGEDIPVTLRFERAGDIDVALPVRRGNASAHGGEH